MSRFRRQLRPLLGGLIAAFAALGAANAAQVPDLTALHEIQRRAGERLAMGDVLGALALTRGEDQSGSFTGLAESWNRQQVIELLAAMGRHRESLRLLREEWDTRRDLTPPTEAEKALSRQMRLQPAVDRLLTVAKERQVLMINEEHWRPEHRAFGAMLLPKLRRLGFRYLALETRDQAALDQAMSTGQVTMTSDSYCCDPQRANLLRAALRSGMKIVAFDVSDPAEVAEMRKDPLGARREDWMARNIHLRILERDPAAKIVVWVGMGHISKKPLDVQGKPIEFMALRFLKRTGIDPYCVNQISDSGAPESDRRVYRLLLKSRKASSTPVLFEPPARISAAARDQAPALWNLIEGAGLDALVLHPPDPMESRETRPIWQSRLQSRRFSDRLTRLLPDYDPASRYLVQALDLVDGPNAAPTDQVMPLPNGAFTLALFPSRTYRLRTWKARPGAGAASVVLDRPLP